MRDLLALTAVSLSLIAGCTDTSELDPGGSADGDFPQAADAGTAGDDFNAFVISDGFTDPADYPVSASYEGTATLLRTGAIYYGVLGLDVEFGTTTLTGTLDQFNKNDGSSAISADVAGSFDITGDISGTNGTFDAFDNAQATGTLDGVDDTMTVMGNFAGPDADAVQLLLIGDVFVGSAYGY